LRSDDNPGEAVSLLKVVDQVATNGGFLPFKYRYTLYISDLIGVVGNHLTGRRTHNRHRACTSPLLNIVDDLVQVEAITKVATDVAVPFT
jgi:hypothetical protein